jgi:hypothetical protein
MIDVLIDYFDKFKTGLDGENLSYVLIELD